MSDKQDYRMARMERTQDALNARVARLERRFDAFLGTRNTTALNGPGHIVNVAPWTRDETGALRRLLDELCGVVAEANSIAERYHRRFTKQEEETE